MALKTIKGTDRIVQIGSQRRSGSNYMAANDFIRSGKFGPITMVELTWNVNQPGRWRRPALLGQLKEEDTDWKRYLLNRPFEKFDVRKYLEFRLFWPYSSGLPGQWMSHQIDTVHWFSGLQHPRSVVANGGIYMWKDGRKNWDTITAVFDTAVNDQSAGFRSRSLRECTMVMTPCGNLFKWRRVESEHEQGFTSRRPDKEFADEMQAAICEMSLADAAPVIASANTGGDNLTSNHIRNWMECIRSRQQPHAPVEAGYSHSIATIMANAAVHTGLKVTFDEKTQEIMAGGKAFKY